MMKEMELFDKNKRLVYYVVNFMTQHHDISHSYSGMDKDDLAQLGFIGLWKAAKNFDEAKGFKFSTYAVPMIQGEIIKSIRDAAGTIKVPRAAKLIAKKISKRRLKEDEYNPTFQEIMDEFSCTEDTARIAFEILEIHFLSLDAPAKSNQNEKTSLMDIIQYKNSQSDFSSIAINNIALQEKLSLLDEREKRIVLLSMNEIPQREIAVEFGISQVQVSRLLKKAINKMKDDLEVAV